MHHELKAQPDSFELLSRRQSQVQLRKNDRDFNAGDTCSFYEWIPQHGIVSGHTIQNVPIITLLKEHEGLTPGWCLIVLEIPTSNITHFESALAGKTTLTK